MMPPDVMARASVSFSSLGFVPSATAVPPGDAAAAAAAPTPSSFSSKGRLALRSALEQFGFAVVTDVVPEDVLRHWESLWAADLMSIVDKTASDPAAVATLSQDPIARWPLDQLSLGYKFASHYGLPQGRLAWAVRRSAEVKHVFANLFDTSDLCVGTDNIFFNNRPLASAKDAERTSDLWPHADQNLHKEPSGNWDVYQGVMYLWPANVDSSATVIWPGSNRDTYFELMRSKAQWARKGHFCMLPKAQHDVFARAAARVPVPRGGLLLWSSRTIHQGWPHGARLAVPVCFEPKSRRDTAALKRKKECVLHGVPTSHWASLGLCHSLHGSAGLQGQVDGIALASTAHLHFGSRLPDDVFELL